MKRFFEKYEIIVEQQGVDNKEYKPIANQKDFQKHPEFNGAVHVFELGNLDAIVYFESISKASFIRFAKNYERGEVYKEPELKVLSGGLDDGIQ